MAAWSSWRALGGAIAWCSAMGAASGIGASCSAVSLRGAGASTTSSATTGGSSAGGSGAGGVPEGGQPDGVSLDANGYCGNQVHQVVTDPPNLYFVFDVSGSMGDMAGGGFTKYEIVEHSALVMIETLGPLINIGAAVFPHNATLAMPCAVGAEVMPVLPGDPISPMTGPTTEEFIVATSLTPAGGTPTAATLTALQPGLVKLKGRTVVILSTDGGPNCDAAITCGADQCIPNIEGQCTPASSNCCAAGASAGPEGCLDHDATVASVAALAAAKIPVVVVGVPGSDAYASVLTDMAKAGGAEQPMAPYYYAVDDLTTLSQVFQAIAEAYVSCDVTLVPAPADMDHTNVYFDGTVVLQDPQNGWTWHGQGAITLVGAACTQLKSGKVKDVHIVSGCPTEKST